MLSYLRHHEVSIFARQVLLCGCVLLRVLLQPRVDKRQWRRAWFPQHTSLTHSDTYVTHSHQSPTQSAITAVMAVARNDLNAPARVSFSDSQLLSCISLSILDDKGSQDIAKGEHCNQGIAKGGHCNQDTAKGGHCQTRALQSPPDECITLADHG